MIATIVVCILLAACVCFAVRHIYKTRKSGGCGCGCSGCPSGASCSSNTTHISPPVGGNKDDGSVPKA